MQQQKLSHEATDAETRTTLSELSKAQTLQGMEEKEEEARPQQLLRASTSEAREEE